MFKGDLEHTHLVKGLDYALLNKIKSEIEKKPDFDDAKEGTPRCINFTSSNAAFLLLFVGS
jgi:RED-like protein N-terminal region